MAKIFIKLPQILKRKINQDTLEAENLKEVLEQIKKLNLPIKNCLFFLNQEKIDPQNNLEQKLKDKDVLELFLFLAGG